MNKIIIAAFAGLVVGYASSFIVPSFHKQSAQTNSGELSGRIVLGRTNNGTFHETGLNIPYDVTGVYPAGIILISPDKTKAVYAIWEDTKFKLYVSDIDGNNSKMIAEQQVPEGSGSLYVSSIQWSEDGTHVSYVEDGAKCKKAFCAQPDDFALLMITYSVDVRTGEKTVVSSNER